MPTVDTHFFDRVNEIISLANEHAKHTDPFLARGSLIYAAARFTAYEIALKSKSKAEMRTSKENALKYFTEEYSTMLTQLIDDHLSSEDSLV